MLYRSSNRRQYLLALAASSFAMLPGVPYAQVASAGDAIDTAEALHMTSQRATKGYLAIAQGIQSELAVKVRDAAITQFDRQLIELRAYAPTPTIKKTYTDLQAVWLEILKAYKMEISTLRARLSAMEKNQEIGRAHV